MEISFANETSLFTSLAFWNATMVKHPFDCKNIFVIKLPDNAVGMILCLHVYLGSKLAKYILNHSSSYGCLIEFVSGNL